MAGEKKIKMCVFISVLGLHAAVLFLVAFKTETKRQEPETIRLINLSHISSIEEEKPAAAPKPRARKPEPEREIPVVREESAENVVETEEEPLETGSSAGDAETGAGAGGGYAASYIQENYSYVQRRITQELIYPSQARRAGIQGVVEVIFTIRDNGTASDIVVRKSSGKTILDEEALRAVRSASPFRRPETPVRIIIPVSFKLT